MLDTAHVEVVYRKILIIRPGLLFIQGSLHCIILGRGLLLENFVFQNWLELTVKGDLLAIKCSV